MVREETMWRRLITASVLITQMMQTIACTRSVKSKASSTVPCTPSESFVMRAPKEAPRTEAEAEAEAKKRIITTLDDWHDAAARADEARYFAHFDKGAVFLGTDATERWDVPAFRAFAHPHFQQGKAWSFRVVRRAIIVDSGGRIGWFDEDLATPNMGPARGSGVVVRARAARDSAWRIAQYNLALTVPNERMDEVKRLLSEGAGALPPKP